jgi:pSer/pThr/pTyr-binding forkhead associated (FHA) protein
MKAKMKLVVGAGPHDEQEYPLDAEVVRLGRERARTIPIHDTQVSRRHAEITCGEGDAAVKANQWSVSDLDSSNGTFVNGERVTGSRALRKGDKVRVGRTTFRFEEIESGRAFHNLVAVLIAVSTLVGAIVAWRINAAMDDAEDADADGLAALIENTQAEGSIASNLAIRQAAFADYHWQQVLAAELGGESASGLSGAQAYRRMAAVNFNLVEPDYVVQATNPTDERFDSQRFGEALYAAEERRRELDATATFATADRLRATARNLTFVGVLLALSVFLYTGAEVSRSALKYGLAGLGFAVFILGTLGALLVFL